MRTYMAIDRSPSSVLQRTVLGLKLMHELRIFKIDRIVALFYHGLSKVHPSPFHNGQ